MYPSHQSARWRHSVIGLSVHPSFHLSVHQFLTFVTKLVNTIFWKRMHRSWCKLAKVVYGTRSWNDQLLGSGGQGSESQKSFSARCLKNYPADLLETQQAHINVNTHCITTTQMQKCKGKHRFGSLVEASFSTPLCGVKVTVKVWTLAIVPLTRVRLVSQWCCSALCGHPFPALTDSWTHSAASRHTIAPISHTRPSPHSCSYYSFPILLRVGGWVGLSTQ